jgi:hypothetical protein
MAGLPSCVRESGLLHQGRATSNDSRFLPPWGDHDWLTGALGGLRSICTDGSHLTGKVFASFLLFRGERE